VASSDFFNLYKMLIVGIAGGSGSGKTTVVRKLVEQLPENSVVVIPQDAYYKDHLDLRIEERQRLNFDHPDSIEFALLTEQISALKAGKTINRPIYSMLTCSRSEETVTVLPKGTVIVEGILLLTNKKLRDLCDVKVYVHADSDVRLLRIVKRDLEERGRDIQAVIHRYEDTVKPMHEQFIEPSKKFADLIIPEGGSNRVAISVLASTIKSS
jgi:uridine kinase